MSQRPSRCEMGPSPPGSTVRFRGDCRSVPERRAQAAVEFVLILAPLLLLMIGALEAVIVASIALSVHEVAVSAVRYAAVNPAAAQAAVVSYAKSVAPSLINDQYLTLTLSPSAGGRLTGTSVSFTASYSLAGKTFATTSILGMTFPSSLSSTVTMTSE